MGVQASGAAERDWQTYLRFLLFFLLPQVGVCAAWAAQTEEKRFKLYSFTPLRRRWEYELLVQQDLEDGRHHDESERAQQARIAVSKRLGGKTCTAGAKLR